MTTIRAMPAALSIALAMSATLLGGAANAASPFVTRSLSPGLTREGFRGRTLAVFDRLDADGDGSLDAADALAYARLQAARERARNAGALLAMDLDGDGALDAREVAVGVRAGLALPALLSASTGAPDDVARTVVLSLDRDADARVSIGEILAMPVPESYPNPVSAFLDDLAGGTGRLDRDAFARLMLAGAFDRADADGDGVLTGAEVSAFTLP